MQKIIEFTVNRTFVFWALIGGVSAFAAQIIFLGDVAFWLFWLLNVVAAGAAGSVAKWLK